VNTDILSVDTKHTRQTPVLSAASIPVFNGAVFVATRGIPAREAFITIPADWRPEDKRK